MSRVATRPLDSDATAAANAAAANAYPTTPSPGDQNYAAFQKTWMDAYVANGGGYTEQTPKTVQAEIQEARQQASGKRQTAHVAQPCPESINTHPSGFAPPSTPCTCMLTSLAVTCSHGRSARDGLLQVVADEVAIGDAVTIAPNATGDCATNLVLRCRGFASVTAGQHTNSTLNHANSTWAGGSSETTGISMVTHETNAPGADQFGSWGWWNASPNVGNIEATTCGGNSQFTRVERFPAGESKFQLNFSKLLEGCTKGFGKLPVDLRLFTENGTTRDIRRAGEAKAEDFTIEGLKKRFNNNAKTEASAEIVGKLASAWREEKSSNLVYCEVVAILAADPLWEAGFSILIYGITVPKKFKKYFDVTAGLFLNVSGKLMINAQVSLLRYPQLDGKVVWQDVQGTGGGEVKIGFSAEVCVWRPSLLQAKGEASVSASAVSSIRNDFGSKVWVDTQLNAGKLAVTVTFKTLWGLMEYEREWQICDGLNENTSTEVLDFSR